MDKLIKIIGLAPSEKSQEEFMEDLNKERRRVVAALSVPYVSKTRKPSKASVKTKARNNLAEALAELGMTPEEFIKANT